MIITKFIICILGFSLSATVLKTTIYLEMIKVDIYEQAILSILYCINESYNWTKLSLIHSEAESKNKLILEHLKILQDEFLSLSDEKRKDYFSKVRNRYNEIHLNGKYDFEKAADFIFLNKTCFNGLYRVNSKGEFNVPFGKYKNPLICDSENLILISKLLQNVEIRFGDYSICEEYVEGKTFIYFDPPYRPLIENSSFVGYDKSGFNDNNQKELAEFVKKLDKHNCLVMLSNSDPKNTNPDDNFFDELYKGLEIDRIFAKRMINCQADKRGDITEIVVRNYKRRK